MSMKKLLRLVAALAIICAMLSATTISSSAALFGVGEPATLASDELEGGPYTVVVEYVNSFVLRLWGHTILNRQTNSCPFKSVAINETAAENKVVLSGGEATLRHLAIKVDEDAKLISIGLPDMCFWKFAKSSVDILIGAPVKEFRISVSSKVDVNYATCTLEDFYLKTEGPVTSAVGFDAPINKLTANLASGSEATFTGEEAAEVDYKVAGLSTINAFTLPTVTANIVATGYSKVYQMFTMYSPGNPEAEVPVDPKGLPTKMTIIGAGYSDIYYNWPRYDLEVDPQRKNKLPKPEIIKDVAGHAHVEAWVEAYY